MDIGHWALLTWAVVMTALYISTRPPLRDRGHRCFAVAGKNAARRAAAARVIVGILGKHGLGEKFTFSPGGTTQTLLADGGTVIIQHDDTLAREVLPPNAISVVTKDPLGAAHAAAQRLRSVGFTAMVMGNVLPEAGDKFVFVISDAFQGWGLAFRRHVFAMGKPPRMGRLT